MTLSELMSKLEELLADELGTFANGQLAIHSYPPLPPSGIPNGLACLVSVKPELYRQRGSTGKEKAIEEFFIVQLVQYNTDKSTATASRIIQMNFPIFSIKDRPADEKTFEQCTIRIRNYYLGR